MAEHALDRQSKRRQMMLEQPVERLIPKMALPTITSMLIMSLYNLADTFFVTKLGTAATGAVGINFSLMSVIQAAAMSLGVGASSYISRLLGAKQDRQASATLATAFYVSMIVGGLIAVFGLIFLRPLVVLLGATETVVPYAMDYARYILYSAPFISGAFVLNQSLRAEGSATFSMIGMVSGAFLNLALDPLFIFVFNWGVAGAAAATAISKVVSFIILLIPYFRKSSLLTLDPKLFSLKKEIVVEISKMGFPTLLRSGLMTVAGVVTNVYAGSFSDSALAAISIVNRVMMFIGSAIIGFGQGFQPVAGFNWGAKRYDRVWKAFWFSSYVGVIGIVLLCAVIYLFAPTVIGWFTVDDQTIIELGQFSIRLQCLAMPLSAWVIVVNMLFQSIGRATEAAILSLSRQGIAFIPSIIVLSSLFGVEGLASAQAVADVLSLLIALPMALRILKLLKTLMANQPSQVEVPIGEPQIIDVIEV